MTQANKIFLNFAGGEVTPDMQIRTDLPINSKVLARCKNFITFPTGKAVFRPGSIYVHHTRNHNPARFIEFQFSDVQSYLIEVTDSYFRFYKDGAVILADTAKTITGVTKANPGVVTYTGADPTNGQEVYIDGIVGMTQLNGRFFTVANVNAGANTFELNDEFGNTIDTSAYTSYSSAGTWTEIYEVSTPYAEADIEELQFAQTADTMYIVHRNYEPYKLTRTGHASWSLAAYARTADPYPNALTINAITEPSSHVQVAFTAAHNLTAGTVITISDTLGSVELNGNNYKVSSPTSTTFLLADPTTGALIAASTVSAWTSGGTVTVVDIYPGTVSFTEDARTVMGGSDSYPERLWYSRSPSSAGNLRFDDYTTGTADDNAMIFNLAPLKGRVDSVRWIANTDKFLVVGTFGSVRRVFGASEAEPATPTGITAKMVNADGVKKARPVVDGSTTFYITRNGLSVESVEYDYQIDGYSPDNKNLISDHLTEAFGLKQLSRQVGHPTIIWVVRDDGVLLGLTYKARENIAGWHQHHLGGSGIVEWAGVMPRDNSRDQLWLIVKRTVGGNTVRHIEYLSDLQAFPLLEDFFFIDTEAPVEADDKAAFFAYQWEVAKQSVHLDAALVYDGSDYGTDASATLTPGSGADTVGTTSVTFTASAAVFTSDMVGRELWGKFTSDGSAGGGRATITAYTNSTHVVCTITEAWPIQAFAAGDWYITASTVTGLWHLNGETVSIVIDGSEQTDDTVSAGSLTLATQGSVVHVGLKYEGLLKTLPIDAGGVTGGAISKPMNVTDVGLWLRDCAGISYGSNLYRLTNIDIRSLTQVSGRSYPLFNGLQYQSYRGAWERNTALYIRQSHPLPATILGMDTFLQVTDE